MKVPVSLRAAVIAAFLSPAWIQAQPIDRAELQALRAQVQQLEQQLKVLSHQLELKEQAAASPAPAAAKATATDKGYGLASADAANTLRLRALLQTDARFFFSDGGIVNDSFALRRARLGTEGTMARHVGYQFVTEFGGSSVSILDANLTLDLTPTLQFKAGKYKTPLGHEELQSDSATFLSERSIVANLLPNRDLGLQLTQTFAHGALVITGGVFNGVPDGANSSNSDFDERKDLVARVVAAPFRNVTGSPLHGFSFGVGASQGRQRTTAGRTAGYRTDGLQTFFTYQASVLADGDTWRISPFVDYRAGPLGLMGEYVVSTVNLRPGANRPKAELKHEAWQLTAGYVLTGEDSTYGVVSPRADFDPAGGTWGAFEVTGRYSSVDFDDAAFPLFASPSSSATDSHAYALGLNWYLTKAVIFKFDYYHTKFGLVPGFASTAATPLLQHDEKFLVTRFQVMF